MKTVFHPAVTRGYADLGWLRTWYSFSFASYHNPERMQFGALRVLNDDVIAPAKGFGKHHHGNMEIISLPISGALEHKDDMGNITVIREGEIQVMSAGTGISHSEINKNRDSVAAFLQIWIIPDKKNVEPRYDQLYYRPMEHKGPLVSLVSPEKKSPELWIHQNAWVSMMINPGKNSIEETYLLHDIRNGVYHFLIKGTCDIEGHKLKRRDALGVWSANRVQVTLGPGSCLLLIEVPMQ